MIAWCVFCRHFTSRNILPQKEGNCKRKCNIFTENLSVLR
ncbi:hypothetical protein ANACOL_01936 [Anaerotruncus colihominis DSM 17241]|uniref:Uncharacterized protein n=1 Tax=Anaerotruncus colihominis DSM 17241 TaxID=445972 RepID=B0PAY5_9FIRM|nr:hypothetical protein ANACOL_01936 [Anaerotruncus colihominis DSM 17241]